MANRHFHVGDRVRVVTSTFLPLGTTGTIVQTFIGEDDLYDVQFDTAVRPYLMLVGELERSDDTPPAGLHPLSRWPARLTPIARQSSK